MADGTKNLMVERSSKSVWDKPGLAATLSTFDRDRWVAAALGSTLVLVGARQKSFGGGLMATLGSVMTVRAAMGRHDLKRARTWIDRGLRDRGYRRSDVVDDASDDSFPASDSPSWTATGGATTNT